MSNVVAFRRRGSLFSPEQLNELRSGSIKEDPKLTRAYLGKSDGTASVYRRANKKLDAWLCGRTLTDELLADFITAEHERGLAPPSICITVSAAKFRAKALRHPSPYGMETEAMLSMARRKGAGRGRGSAAPVTMEQVQKICRTATARGSLWGARDASLISLMFVSGLRVSEVTHLDVEDLEVQKEGSGLLTIRRSKTDAYGAGTVLPVPQKVVSMVMKWVGMAGIVSGVLFPAIQKCGFDINPVVTDRRMTTLHVGRLVPKRASVAGVTTSSHGLRRGFAQHLASMGMRDSEIQTAGRWKTPAMVSVYLRNQKATQSRVAKMMEW